MVSRLTTSLSHRHTLRLSASRFGAAVRRWSSAPVRGPAFAIALMMMFAIVNAQAVASPGYPDNTFTTCFYSLGSSGWFGGDGTRSVRLPDGRSAWLFSDTITATARTGLRFVHNSIVITGQGRPRVISHPLPPLADASYFWLGAARVKRGELWILAQRIVQTGSGLWDFRFAGTWLGRIEISRWSLISLRPVAEARCPVNWSVALFDSGAHTYIYGLETDGLTRWLHVARVPRGRLDLKWKFYTGTGWVTSSRASTRVLSGVSVVSMLDLGRRGLRLVSQQPILGRVVNSWRARSPVGPFTNRRAIYDTGSFGQRTYTYDTVAHPQHTTRGTMLFSFNVNSYDFLTPNTARLYHPHFFRVPLGAI